MTDKDEIKRLKKELSDSKWALEKTDKALKSMVKDVEGKVEERTRELKLLADSAMEFVELPAEENIYKHILKRLSMLIGDSIVAISIASIDEEKNTLTVQDIQGPGKVESLIKALSKLVGGNIIGKPMPQGDENMADIIPGDLAHLEEGIYKLLFKKPPKIACRAVEKLFGIDKIYAIGYRRGKKLFGNTIIAVGKGKDLENKEVIKAFVNQAAVALERKLVEEKLKEEHDRRLAELMEVDRMKDEFLSITTHELKTPLMPAKLQAEMLLNEKYGEVPGNQKNSLKVIVRNINRLNHLVDNIMTISKLDQNKLEFKLQKQDIGELIQDIGSDMALEAGEKTLYFRVHMPKKLPKVNIDDGRFKQVLLNLLDNAIKFTEEGGITVTVGVDDDELKITVEDTGVGIPRDELEKIFQRFYQVDHSITRKYPGNGLGLAISKGIIEQHKGKIWAESEGEGKGSKFYIVLPLK